MVRLTDRLDMTIAVDWDVKSQTKQKLGQAMRKYYLLSTVDVLKILTLVAC